MVLVSEQQYLRWQNRLTSSPLFRYWWQFWSNYAFVFFIPAFAWIGLHRNPYMILGLCAVSFFTARVVITTVLNKLYERVRPYQKYKFVPITSRFFSLQTTIPNSFPSRHTGAYASVAFTILAFYPEWGLILIGVTVLTGIARVVLGYHYPSDIFAGLIIGALTGSIIAWAGPLTLFT